MSSFASPPFSPSSTSSSISLSRLGWRPFFSTQLVLAELEAGLPARIVAVHRSGPEAQSEKGRTAIALTGAAEALLPEGGLTVGDWVLLEAPTPGAAAGLDAGPPRLLRVLARESLFSRMAAGKPEARQAIAANVDTLFVVTSCNHDFNPPRLERHLALAAEARVQPVLLLTKRDLAGDAAPAYEESARRVAPRAEVIALDATARDEVAARLAPWLGTGQTVAFVGSSGVGKSTLVNALLGAEAQATAGIREDDSRGRHTTTARRMLLLGDGAWLVDTPGMRELKIGAAEEGVAAVFDDVASLARGCRFRDCRHGAEQGCAVQAALADGRLDPRRYASYAKLENEARRAGETAWQRHERARKQGRLYKSVKRRLREERER
ncbi:MAG TPA: ribosome small subunit-dependent GTPase A [Gammaproteobacteria bacterium]|nr:ribosome small subunit-dependent GTPase A [Gammaproteobacteria bacterium]